MSSSNIPEFSDVLSIQSNPEDLFILLSPIGIGAYAKVYKAMHKSTLKIFAIKIVDYAKDGKNNINNNYNKIKEEASLMHLLQNNDYILKYYGSYYSLKSNNIWLILEYCYCGSLLDFMSSIKIGYTEEEIATFIEMILQGLIFLHDMNIIHRDIKAQNIYLTEDGCVKLGDFGEGIKLTEEEKYRRSKRGSPYWMSPQVILQNDYDTKTDIWSLGITCSQLADSKETFWNLKQNAVMNKIGKQPPKVEDIIKVENYSESFVDFVRKCLVVDQNERPSAKELIEHEFIKKNAKGRDYIKSLIKKYENEIKIYFDEKRESIKNIEKIKNNSKEEEKEEGDENEKDNNINDENNENRDEEINDINNKDNQELYSYKSFISEEVVKQDNNNDNIDNIDDMEGNTSMIIKDDKQNEEIGTIIDETKKMIDEIDINSNEEEDEEDYYQKKLEEEIKKTQEKIKMKKEKLKKKEENEDTKENAEFNMKTPTKKDKNYHIQKDNINIENNIIDKAINDIKPLLSNEDIKNINKRSEVTTGLTGPKTDSMDVSNKTKFEKKILPNDNNDNNNNIFTNKKIDFNQDLSNIDDDSGDEGINPIKNIFNVISEDNRLEKCQTEKKYLLTAQKQNRINFLDAGKIKKYLNGFDINTFDDNSSKNIHLSAYKKHKQYFK